MREMRSQRQGVSNRQTTTIMVVVAVPLLFWLLFASQGSPPGPVNLREIEVDMHCHTTESDGDRTAEEQLVIAAREGLKALWITDHDMIRDIPRTREIQAKAQSLGVAVSFGVEITVEWMKKEHHLLGYFPDSAWDGPALSPAMTSLQQEVAKVKDSRENRNQEMVRFLNEMLVSEIGRFYYQDAGRQAAFRPIKVDVVAEWSKTHANLMEPTSLGRPHFRAYLIEVVGIRDDLIFGPRSGDGFAVLETSTNSIFYDDEAVGKAGERLEALMHSATLARRNIAFRPMDIFSAIQAISSAGGRSVLAHPPTLGSSWPDKFAPRVEDLAAAGLWGIEAFSSEIDADNHALIAELAKRHHLVMTGGSDNHGSLKIYARLGDVHRADSEAYKQLEYWFRTGLKASTKVRTTDL